jgi:hypothetical protein
MVANKKAAGGCFFTNYETGFAASGFGRERLGDERGGLIL